VRKKPLDELYFVWLYSQVGSVEEEDRSRTYWALAKKLYCREFVWIVPNDDNRAEDGRDLRKEFLDIRNIRADRDWLRLGCSILELLIALSQRLSFEGDGESRDWFWFLIKNLGLKKFSDDKDLDEIAVDNILDRFVWRNYEPNGEGGLFPLKRPMGDQRRVEIWYQMSSYLLEED